MAAFAGQIVLVVNGLPIVYVKSLDYKCTTNRELVTAMMPTSTPAGHVEGSLEYTLSLDCYVPHAGDLPWESISDAVIGVAARDGGAPDLLFVGCFVTSVGLTFQEKGAAIRKIEMGAVLKVGV